MRRPQCLCAWIGHLHAQSHRPVQLSAPQERPADHVPFICRRHPPPRKGNDFGGFWGLKNSGSPWETNVWFEWRISGESKSRKGSTPIIGDHVDDGPLETNDLGSSHNLVESPPGPMQEFGPVETTLFWCHTNKTRKRAQWSATIMCVSGMIQSSFFF